MTNTDILIIGAGPAGLTAGLYSARAGAKTIIIENMAAGGQINLTPDIANVPGFLEISGQELGLKMLAQAENAGCEIVYDEITEIDFKNKTIKAYENTIKYKALIIAGGCRPRELGIPREQDFIGGGIHFCGLCDGAFYKGKNIVVVGGGNHAVEEAIYLSDIAKSVTMVVDADKFKAQETLIKQLGKKAKVHFKSSITEITGDTKITGVVLKDKTKIATDGIFVAIGRAPNTELYKGKLDLSKDGYIVVDFQMQTSIQGVFAAGDIIQKRVRQVVTACADGSIAGSTAATYIKLMEN